MECSVPIYKDSKELALVNNRFATVYITHNAYVLHFHHLFQFKSDFFNN